MAAESARFPINSCRTPISERKEIDGTVKIYRFIAQDGSVADIEAQMKESSPRAVLRPLDPDMRILGQEGSHKDGYLHKLVIGTSSGHSKEYFIPNLPSVDEFPELQDSKSKKRTAGEEAESEETKRAKLNILPSRRFPPSDEFLLLLAKTFVEDVHSGEPTPMVFAELKEPVSSAFKKLTQHNLLAIPVVLQDGSYHGFLDILDVTAWIANIVGETALTRSDVDLDKLEELHKATVQNVMTYPISKKNPFHPFKVKSSLLSAMEELSRGAHRIPVVDEDGKLVNIITQGTALRFLHKHLDLLGEKKGMLLSSMYFKSSQYVMSLSEHESAINAFRLLGITRVSAVAVVDENGVLVGNCSARDLKKSASTLSHRFVSRLFKPLSEFIKGQELVTASPNDTLETVIRRVIEKKVHRVYVVDEDGKPQGLFSLSDILEEVLKR